MENRNSKVRGRDATWALGSLAVFFFAVEALTGFGLAFHYRPTLDSAHASVVDLREASALGWVSKLHYWGSHALIIVVWLHLVRMFLLGLYKSSHRKNWIVGVTLLVPTLMLAATGARLPMDRAAVATLADGPPALEAGSGSLRAEPEEQELWRFYVLHCIFLPAVAAALIVVHVKLARRPGSE